MIVRTSMIALTGLFTITAVAQDSLFYMNGAVIVGQVEEIGLDQIKYHTSSDGNKVLIVVDKNDLSSVKLKGGQAFNFTVPGTEGTNSAAFLARKNALTLDVISPALNHITIGYERVVGPRISLWPRRATSAFGNPTGMMISTIAQGAWFRPA